MQSLGLLALTIGLSATSFAEESSWTQLLDPELSKWEIFVGVPHKTVEVPGQERTESENGISGTPLGLNNDPLGIFKMITEDGQPVLHISGQIYAGLNTKEEFENYHLSWQFKWGEKKWPPRLKKKRDSGMLIHCVGKQGAFWNVWMRSLECQVQEGDCGDFIPLAGSAADLRVKPQEGEGRPTFDPKGQLKTGIGYASHGPSDERPNGEWNTMEIYTLGQTSVFIVNGTPNMVLFNGRQKTANGKGWEPLTKGKIQIQSEAAEIFYRDVKIRPITDFPQDLRELTTMPADAPGEPSKNAG